MNRFHQVADGARVVVSTRSARVSFGQLSSPRESPWSLSNHPGSWRHCGDTWSGATPMNEPRASLVESAWVPIVCEPDADVTTASVAGMRHSRSTLAPAARLQLRCPRRGRASESRYRARSTPTAAARRASLRPTADTSQAAQTPRGHPATRPREHRQSPARPGPLPIQLLDLKYSCHAFTNWASRSWTNAVTRFSSAGANPWLYSVRTGSNQNFATFRSRATCTCIGSPRPLEKKKNR